MLIKERPPGGMYPQITQFPTNYFDFLAAFRGGQTIDDNLTATVIASTPQAAMLKIGIESGHLTKTRKPVKEDFVADIFLTDEGAEQILVPTDRPFCQMAVELAQKSVAEDDGKLHPYVGVVIVKNAKIVATGHRGESGRGDHGEFCALKKLNEDVDNVDLSGCTVYTTLEPCSKRNPPKIPCATRLIKAKAARVVSGMPDKDKEVYGLSSLAEAGIHIGLFPPDLMQKLIALNKKWSDSRREEPVAPPPNLTNAIANVAYYKPGTSMQDNIFLVVRAPNNADGFYTIEDAAKNVLAYARSIEEIAIKWHQIDDQKVIVEKQVRQGAGSSNRLLNLT